MIPSLSQETLTQYASDAQTIQEPTGADYSRGVSVGRTIPAKWWNWLFSNATKRIVQSRNDADNMLTELKNVVTDAGLTPSGSDNTQLTQAIQAKADEQIDNYVENKKGYFIDWLPIAVTLDLPSGYSAHTYASDTGIVMTIGYQTEHTSLTSKFYCKFLIDGSSWTPQVTLETDHGLAMDSVSQCTCFKFKGKYFIFIAATDSPSWQYSQYGYVFVSEDAVNWQLSKSIKLVSSNTAVSVNNYQPAFGYGDSALYILCTEGMSAPVNFTRHLYKSTDGYNWSEIATGFQQRDSTIGHKVIEVGSGFYWGNYVFDGTSVTRVYDTSVYSGFMNPIVFSSGKALYLEHSLSIAYPGATPVATTFTQAYNAYSMRTAQMLLNNTKVAVPVLSSPPYNIGPGSYVPSLYIIDENLTETEFPLLPGVQSGGYIPFEVDGIIYSYKHKSTDLASWTEITGMPEGSGGLSPALAAGVFFCATSNPVTNYISTDNLVSWRQISAKVSGGVMFGARCWSRTVGAEAALGGYITMNQINRVIGHTLYLR